MKQDTVHNLKENSLLQDFEKNLAAKQYWNKQDPIFLAISGGIDSIVLADLMLKTGHSFTLLHCNFHLRDEDSKRDEDFVRAYAASVSLPLVVEQFDTRTAMKTWGIGVQEAARKLRYAWFEKMVDEAQTPLGHPYVLTAHHADDLAETLLIHFLRGTGIAGLHGIPEKNGHWVRPLLFATRERILAYALQNNLQWVEDHTNAENHYTRNLVRNKIFPELELVFPSVKKNLVDNAKRFSEAEVLYRMQLKKIMQKLVKNEQGRISIPVELLRRSNPLDTILYEIFSPFGFSAAQTEEIKKLFDAPTGKWISSSSHRVLKNRNWLVVDTLENKASGIHVIDAPDCTMQTPDFTLAIRQCPKPVSIETDLQHAWLDAKELTFPMVLRKWKEGDYFYPLGLRKKKKVARFLTDIKLSKYEKERQWVLVSGHKIIWVLGKRIDDRFKMQESTLQAMHISLLPKNQTDEGLKRIDSGQ